MIIVETDANSGESEVIDFTDATRFSTDEHNNLAIWTGPAGDMLMHLFSARLWRSVGADPSDCEL
jgi:hypothetical protein